MADMTTLSLEDVDDELAVLDSEIAELRDQIQPLELRREKILSFKGMFEEFIATRSVPEKAEEGESIEAAAGEVGMTIVEASEIALTVAGEWKDTRSLITALEELGIESQAANVYTSVFGTLNREVKRADTKLAKRNGKWGLLEWLEPKEDAKEMMP